MKLRDFLVPICDRRRLLGAASFLGIAFGIGHFLLMARVYESGFVVLPPQQEQSGFMSGVNNLAVLAGLSMGASSDPSVLYPAVLRSERVLTRVLTDSVPDGGRVVTMLGFDNSPAGREEAEEYLHRKILVSRDKLTGIVKVSVRLGEPEVAELVARKLLAELDGFFRESRRSSAYEQRLFLTDRVREVKDALATAELQLTDFLEQNRHFEGSPDLQLAAARLRRQVTMQETIYIELEKQLELARISEAQDTAALSVLDRPREPVRPFYPNLVHSVLLAFALCLVLALVWVFYSAYGKASLGRELSSEVADDHS